MAEPNQKNAPSGAGAASAPETTNKFQAAISAWRSMAFIPTMCADSAEVANPDFTL